MFVMKVAARVGAVLLGMLAGVAATGAATSGATPVEGATAALVFETLQYGSELKGQTPERAPAPVLDIPYRSSFPGVLGQGYAGETEPNGSTATASPLVGDSVVVRANLYPNGDIDFYSFTAQAGDRVYAATLTSFSAGNSTDSQLTLLDTDGTTIIEFDDDNGSFAALSSSIAGAVIPAAGTYFLRVNDFTAGTTTERGYELHFRLQRGAPTPEVEANDTPATANPLPVNGWVSGARNPAAATEQDWYSINLNAGDTVFLSLDVDPEDDLVVWNGRLGFGLFGDASNQILVVDDAGTGDVLPNPNRPSEAMFFTVKNAGTYFAFVDSANAATGGPTATYHLSVTVRPATDEGVNCTTYTSTNVPQTIGPGTGLVSSTLTVPGNPRIADLDVSITLNHALMQDIDAHLRSPAGSDIGLFTDIGAAAVGGQNQMDVTFDDEAGVTPAFTALRGVQIKPENNSTAGTASTSGAYRLSWFDGQDAGGTWTLDLRDDTTGANGGTLTAWSLRICEPPPPPACPPGTVVQTVYSTDFESGDAGFTHSGTADEWERGLPATVATTTANPVAAFTTCNSGVNCWKTDLDNTYNANSNQDLLSPNIDLTGLLPPVIVTWAQRHQVETANFDHMFVDFQQVGGATPVRLFEWIDPTPISASAGTGNPQNNIGAGIGWGVLSRRADSLAGLNTELRFHLDSEASVQFGGWAIDDVSVSACRLQSADLSITKTDGVATATPGGSVTYTITASNAGPDAVTGATVADTFPAILTCTWTCVGAGGGTCTAAGAGNINDSVDLPAGASVTYTASCSVASSATGTLDNTATISSSVTDPDPANNSATDSDTLTPQADLAITKTDGVTTAVPGGSVTYTITASNAGPSDAPAATVADTFPAALTCTWTCVGAGGGTCTAAAAGNIADPVALPVGGSVTYTATCGISASATGSLSNTATVGAATLDPNPANNSATDTDTLTPQADLAITKTDGVTSAVPGGSVTYTITASNAGPSNALGATVTDTFPPSCSGVNWTCVGAGGGTCTAAGAGNISDVVNLPAGGSVTYTAGCTLAANASGSLDNTADVTAPGGVTDPVPGNNSATDSDTLTPEANLAITKTDGVTSATPGGSTTYTIVASNTGPSDAPGSSVSDTFPAACTTVAWTCAGAAGGTCTAAGAGNIADTVALPAGGSVTYTATCSIDAGASGSLDNTATVATGAGITDPAPGDNTATDVDALGAEADLSITKTDGVTSVLPGGSVTYTIVASNAGPSAATGATVSDTFPAALTCSTTCVGSGGGTCAAGPVAGNLADTVNLPAGASVTYTATCTVDVGATGTIDNTATVAAPAGVTDPTPGNNSATDSDVVTAQADLSVTLVDSIDPAAPGGTLGYAAVATNGGVAPANDVTLALALDADTTFASFTASAGSICTTPAVGSSGTVNCTWAGVTAVSATRTLDVVVNVVPAAVGTLSATATTASLTPDPVGANNTATATTTLATGSADLALTLAAAPASLELGDSTTLTAVAGNSGPADAQDVQISIVLPANLGFASVTPSAGGLCTAPAVGSSGTVVCTFAGTTAVGTTRTVVVTATALSGGAAPITSTAIGTTSDPTPANAQAAATVIISGAAVPVQPILIPALDLRTLLALALALGALGWVALRRGR